MQNDLLIREITEADINICETADSFLQSAMWGEFKSRFGWESKAFLVKWQNARQECRPLLVLLRSLAPGFSFAYVPWGPKLPDDFPNDSRPKALGELALKLKPLLSNNTFFIRFEPPWYSEGDAVSSNDEYAPFLSEKLKRAAATVQAPDTVIVNLSSSCDEILAAMKPKWRYNISLAGKKGVQVKSENGQELETFYSLLKETADRDGIAIHSFDYYKTLFEVCAEHGENRDMKLRLYTAVHEGDTLAAIVVLFRLKNATYLYGASSNIKRNLMAPYALQWKAMQDAKEAGCQYYDLFGIPPNDDPNHPMAGLYRFKTGFGGQIIHRPGSWDYPYKPVVYSLFNIAETLRKKLRDQKKKKIITVLHFALIFLYSKF
ncbi:MAG: peptidoglycan bridge formation glycyltransferase FemA/FemB family protein [Treponema sp.]|jgi:lipid II:glycine glycyltransferase (peptidoglycan interpeptide bridge formation enzyme)|nr:peptidoglycan bridge formation glycyltransferase FemA/FemB family protein [Treponema sp.]